MIKNLRLDSGFAFDDAIEYPDGDPRTPSLCWIFKILCTRALDGQPFWVQLSIPESVIDRHAVDKAGQLHSQLQNSLLSLESMMIDDQ